MGKVSTYSFTNKVKGVINMIDVQTKTIIMKTYFSLSLTLYFVAFACTVDQSDNENQEKNSLILKVGDLFDEQNDLLKVKIYSKNGDLITSFINDSTIIIIPKFNYNIEYRLESLTDKLKISKLSKHQYIIKPSFKIDNGKRETCRFAFISDKKRQTLIYKHRKIDENYKLKEWDQIADTIAILTYQIKTHNTNE